jgi:hypothetical protein
MGTYFASVYNRFLDKITDDMYMELTPKDTIRDLQRLLLGAIPGFEFPRKALEYTILERATDNNTVNIQGFLIENADGTGYEDASYFSATLSGEEINILAILMMIGWLQRQIASVENIRMKYSGTDFKMTSQAAHIDKLLKLLAEAQRESHHLQRLYKRRRTEDGQFVSNWSVFGDDTVLGGIAGATSGSGSNETIKEVIFDGGII